MPLSGRDSGNNFLVSQISDGSGMFPFLLLSFLFFVTKRFQNRKYFGYPKRNDFFIEEDILRNGNGNGNEKSGKALPLTTDYYALLSFLLTAHIVTL